MPGNDLSEIFNNIPFVTRYWFSGTILFSLLGKLNIIDPMRMILLWNRMYSNFEIWRPITALLFYPVSPSTGFHFLINLYFLYSYSSRLENGLFVYISFIFRYVSRTYRRLCVYVFVYVASTSGIL
ncbi:Derlin-1 [Schistosoma japonicum]|nr:Derlin-1 [Schistosoma japonicum]KAH8865365.1 Derlin-1 [Schistosoma japonicum]KAH8865366.1 Derlin-1 [Schistosoma japonicum]